MAAPTSLLFFAVAPIASWLSELDATHASSPGLFVGKPVVLDLSSLDLSPLVITHLIKRFEARRHPRVGLEGVEPAGLSINMPPLLSGGSDLGSRGAGKHVSTLEVDIEFTMTHDRELK